MIVLNFTHGEVLPQEKKAIKWIMDDDKKNLSALEFEDFSNDLMKS